MHPYVNTAIKAAREAGNIIVRYVDRLDTLSIERKSRNDFVSEVDRAAEAAIIETLSKAYPDHDILAEESGLHEAGGEYQWIVDPLDGTTNYLHGYPNFAVSIACFYKGTPEHAVIFDPMRDELFFATRGQGAQMNNHRIRVSSMKSLNDSLLVTGFPFRDDQNVEEWIDAFRLLQPKTSGIRRPGSAAIDLAHTACGRFETFFELGLKPWDIAAGVLLVQEAGGIVTDWAGNQDFMQSGNIIAGGPAIQEQVTALLKTVKLSS